MKENFVICIESLHIGDVGNQQNVSLFLLQAANGIWIVCYVFVCTSICTNLLFAMFCFQLNTSPILRFVVNFIQSECYLDSLTKFLSIIRIPSHVESPIYSPPLPPPPPLF